MTGFAPALIFLILAAAPCEARPKLSELAADAEKIYLLPLAEEPFRLVLEADLGTSPGDFGAKTRFEETLLPASAFAEVNAELLEMLREKFGEKVSPAPSMYLRERSRFGVKWKEWDLKALDADLYVFTSFRDGSKKREASLRLSKIDTEKEAAYIPLSTPQLKFILYHKHKPKKKGKKKAAYYLTPLGRHAAEHAPGKSAADLIKPRVKALLAGEELEERFDSEYFPWAAEYFAGDSGMLKKGFHAHAEKLRERVEERVEESVDDFAAVLDKKLGK